MRFILFLVVIVLAVAGLSACNSKELIASQPSSTPVAEQQKTPPPATDGAPRITAEELHDLWVKGQVLVIDTRAEDAYKLAHIKGAISVPVSDFVAKMDQLPKDKKIVAYCT
jgi:predicted sulfurtransferase